MPYQKILPQEAAQNLNCFHQKLSWKIKEKNWRLDDTGERDDLFLELDSKIPRSSAANGHNLGGRIALTSNGVVAFGTSWPKDMDLKKITVDAVITIKLSDGSSVSIKCDERKEVYGVDVVDEVGQISQLLLISKIVKLDAELLFDENRCFILEAELKVMHVDDTKDNEVSKELKGFVNDIGSIFDDFKTSDVVVIGGGEKFNCHKNILSARCEVFKNMLAPHTSESENDIIEIKEVPSEAVRTMLKYIYNGEVPKNSEMLTPDLLNLAEMYLLDHLKEACVKSLLEMLEVSSCISTFIVADRYNSSGNLKEVVMEFIKCKAEEVVETEEWAKLLETDLAVAQELIKVMVKGRKEKHKCRFCVVSYSE